MHGCSAIDALHPGSARTVVEQTRVPAIVRVVAAALGSLEPAAEFAHGGKSVRPWKDLHINIGEISAVKRSGKASPIPMAKPTRFECFHCFIVNIRFDEPPNV